MIWLVTLGLSRYHGSELLVGWQWFTRLSAAAPTTAIISKLFDSDEFIQEADRKSIIFVDTNTESPDEINKRHFIHTYRFWRITRNILRKRVRAGDKIVIVAPAAVWFIPWLPKVPISRSSVYYGPMGAVLLSAAPGTKYAAVIAKNSLIFLLMIVWRLAYRRLPGNLSLRFPAPWFNEFLKSRYSFLGIMPEVELSLNAVSAINASGETGALVAVLFDDRVRKNVANSIAYAAKVAMKSGSKLIVIGAPGPSRQEISTIAVNTGCDVQFEDRRSRVEFIKWLSENKPVFVSLSLSEGVPSTLIEALLMGCEAHVYEVGGLHWLSKFAAARSTTSSSFGIVEKIRWDDKSVMEYQRYVKDAFARLVDKIVAPKEE